MPAIRGLAVQPVGDAGTTPTEMRVALAAMIEENAPGVPRPGILAIGAADGLLVRGTASMGYQVVGCTAVLTRAADEGIYMASTIGTTTAPAAAAPGTDSRFDLVWIRQLDPEKQDQVNGQLSNVAQVGVTQGAFAASPVAPEGSVPAGALVVARARIYAGTTRTDTAPNVIENIFPWTAMRGSAIRVRNTTELAAISPTNGKTISRLDQGQTLYRGDGSRWLSALGKSKYAEFTSAEKTHAVGKTGPSEYVLDAGNSFFPDFAVSFGSGANAGTISITEPGAYLVDLSLNGATASPIAIGSLARLTNEPQTGTYKETSIGGGVAWSDGVETIVRAGPNTSPANPFYVRVITDFRASWTGSTRLRIAQL